MNIIDMIQIYREFKDYILKYIAYKKAKLKADKALKKFEIFNRLFINPTDYCKNCNSRIN